MPPLHSAFGSRQSSWQRPLIRLSKVKTSYITENQSLPVAGLFSLLFQNPVSPKFYILLIIYLMMHGYLSFLMSNEFNDSVNSNYYKYVKDIYNREVKTLLLISDIQMSNLKEHIMVNLSIKSLHNHKILFPTIFFLPGNFLHMSITINYASIYFRMFCIRKKK